MITNIALALTAIAAGFSGLALLRAVPSFTDSLERYGVPRSWWPWLGAAKVAGAAGALVGFWVPLVGLIAASCLVAYFLGAVITVYRSGIYAHLPIPLVYLALPATAAVLLATN